MTKLIPIVRMDCPICIPTLEKEIQKLPGIKEVRANYITRTIKVTYDSDLVGLFQIETAIERIGYQISYKKYPDAVSKLKALFQKGKPNGLAVISDNDFASKVLHASKPVAILFSSSTCPTCQVAKTTYSQAAKDLAGTAHLYIMDISSSETWRRYDVLCIPTILVFRNGHLRNRLTSLPQKDDIIRALVI
jgi:copper chaperone CopZ